MKAEISKIAIVLIVSAAIYFILKFSFEYFGYEVDASSASFWFGLLFGCFSPPYHIGKRS